MPTNRFNYSDDFVLNNGKVGINSASPQEKLDVVGVTRAENLSVVGVSSLTGYEGFLRANHNVAENTSLEGGQGTTGSLSGEIVIGTGVTVTGVTTATSGQGYIDTLKVYNTFTVPVGLTTDRPTAPKPGQLYYNRDFATIEFFDGDRWRQVDNTTTRGRGVFGGGVSPNTSSIIDYINISSTGNALNFGNLTVARRAPGACSSSTRGLFGASLTVNTIDYIAIASEGNAIDFGDATVTRFYSGSCSSSTRGIWGGGYVPTPSPAGTFYNVIDYVQISTIGNAIDFGDLTQVITNGSACSSPTRGLFGGGNYPPFSNIDIINYITISSLGNGINFGNLSVDRTGLASCSNSTRGVFAGGGEPVRLNTIDYITIASLGNATDFGNLTVARSRLGACSNSIRGVFGGGYVPSVTNTIEYVTISTTGNAIDFGDLTLSIAEHLGCSDSHGGLGGF